MELNVICFKNVKINAFTTPNFTDIDPEIAAIQLERSLIINSDKAEVLAPYKNLDMYHIGYFDDISGKFEGIEPVFILSPREIILEIESKKLKEAEVKKESEVEAV